MARHTRLYVRAQCAVVFKILVNSADCACFLFADINPTCISISLITHNTRVNVRFDLDNPMMRAILGAAEYFFWTTIRLDYEQSSFLHQSHAKLMIKRRRSWGVELR